MGLVFLLLVADHAYLGLLLSIRSFACSGFTLPSLDLVKINPLAFLQGFGQPSSTALLFGVVCLSFSALVVDFTSLGFMLLAKSPTYLELPVLVLPYAHLEFPLFSHGLAQLSFITLAVGIARLGFLFSPFVQEMVSLDSFMFLRHFAQPDPSLFILELAHVGFPTLARPIAQSGLLTFTLGVVRPESVLSVMDGFNVDLPILLKSVNQLESAVFIFGFAHLGPMLLLRSFAYLDFLASMAGLIRFDFLFTLPVVDVCHSELSLFLRSVAWLDLLISMFEWHRIGLTFLLHGFSYVASSIFVLGMSRLGLSLFVCDCIFLGFSLLARSFAHLGFMALALDIAHVGSSLLLQAIACLASTTPAFGMARTELSPLALDTMMVGSLSFLKSLA